MDVEAALSILRSDFAHVELATGTLAEPVAVLFAAFIDQRAEVERLRDLAEPVRDAWIALAGTDKNMVVRKQSNDLYDALGALSTQLDRLRVS